MMDYRAARQIYNSREWRLLRRRVLNACGWRCASCGRAGPLEIHHIRPLYLGGDPFAPENLEARCRMCHAHAHRARARKRRRRESDPVRRRWEALVAEML